MSSGFWEYPMSLDYLDGTDSSWYEWEFVREAVQNSMDTETEWLVFMDGDTLVIRDYGNGVEPKHLIFGVSNKPEGSRGQYGEGLKLGLLVLTRMGLKADIRSHYLHIWNEVAEKHGVKIFRVYWEDAPYTDGTIVHVPNWEYGCFSERFMLPSDPRIIHGHEENYLLDDPGIYAQNIYVCPASLFDDDCAFGYDLKGLKLNRDRSIPETGVLAKEMGVVWATVQDKELLTQLFRAVEEGKGEQWLKWYRWEMADTEAVKEAIQQVYGKKVVIHTSDIWAAEATYRGARPVKFNYGFGEPLKKLVGTDEGYVVKNAKENYPVVPDKRLDPVQRKTIQKLRMLTQRLKYHNVQVKAAAIKEGIAASYNKETMVVKISVPVLSDRLESTKSLLHELGHHERPYVQDATAGMVDAVEYVGAKLVNSYTYRR